MMAQQMTIFDFITEDQDQYVPFYTFALISKNDHWCTDCGSCMLPYWNKETNCYDSKCACCQKVVLGFYPAQMCQNCGCTSEVYEVFAGNCSVENSCRYCIRTNDLLKIDFEYSQLSNR
ncbi:hypothetical protein GFC29_3105 [Anoxybacillus sp. B7M1]|nr:hypothetical protein GFC28_2331 [Anoxybacillus sp. B2M1]ANB64781.1 hypothetical protein GFC29_3105 [Anoxybacillus sp. B7M1]